MGVDVGVVHSRTLLVSGGGDPVSVCAWARCVCVCGDSVGIDTGMWGSSEPNDISVLHASK